MLIPISTSICSGIKASSIPPTAAYYAARLAGAPALSRGNGTLETLTQAQVKELQQLLAKRGFDVGKIDGVIGEGTREAVRSYRSNSACPRTSIRPPELVARLRGG